MLYIPLQFVFPLTLIVAWLRYPWIITRYLNDVRLYVDPKGDVERVIAHRIDYRVGQEFLRMIGLDWEFRPLGDADENYILAGGKRVTFNRIIWVSHSLGTVVSYNVLSALFHKAQKITQDGGDPLQLAGVQRFRDSLRRFVTMASPLDKIAFLFGDKCLRPWPTEDRNKLLKGGKDFDTEKDTVNWWVNFYNIMDPVSGALGSRELCGDQPPVNYHTWSAKSLIPGWSHVAYWGENVIISYILGRTYGANYLRHDSLKAPTSEKIIVWVGILVWLTIGLLVWYLLDSFCTSILTLFRWVCGLLA